MDWPVAALLSFGLLFAGYLLLEGCDYGAGMLLPFIGRSDDERHAVLNTIAPLWEGHEVWLITAGALLFAAFPAVYATLFSGLYLPLVVLLLTLVVRGVAFTLRNKAAMPAWRRGSDSAIFLGSVAPPLLWGVALANLALGLPLDAGGRYAGTALDLLHPYALIGGLLWATLFLVHGAAFLALKLDLLLAVRARQAGMRASTYALGLLAVFAVLIFNDSAIAGRTLTLLGLALALLAFLLCRHYLRTRRYGRSLIWSSATIAVLAAAIFGGLFPRLIAARANPYYSLDIYHTAAAPATLQLIIAVSAVTLPLLAAVQLGKFYLFRQRSGATALAQKRRQRQLRRQYWVLQQQLAHARCLAEVLAATTAALRRGDGDIANRLSPACQNLLDATPNRCERP